MKDIAGQFREFSRLDLARMNQGLSVLEHERWAQLKASLDRNLGRSPGKAGAANRRSAKRVATRLNCAYRRGDEDCEAVVSNLSTGGVFIRTEWPLPIGSEIELSIALEDLGKEVAVKGVVVSNNVDVERDAMIRGMGVRFAKLSQEVAEHLSEAYAAELTRTSDSAQSKRRVA